MGILRLFVAEKLKLSYNSAMLSIEEIKKIAALARISLTDDELTKFARELEQVLDYVAELQKVDVGNAEEVSQVTGLVNVQRTDEAVVTPVREELLACAPEIKDNYIKVKAIL